MRTIALWGAALLALCGCGRKEPPAAPAETPEYRAWKGGQFLRQMAAAGPAPTVSSRVEILPPSERARGPGDFCELYLNGEPLHRFPTARLPDGSWPRWEAELPLRAGPNWLDLWDSTTNRNYRHQVDTRQADDFVLAPTADGYEVRARKRE